MEDELRNRVCGKVQGENYDAVPWVLEAKSCHQIDRERDN